MKMLMQLVIAHAILRGNFQQLPRTIMDVPPTSSANTSLVAAGNVPVEGVNEYNKHAGKGGWGGQCTCADGQVYQVGDNGDSCATLACEGGIRGKCNRHNGDWSGAAVKCAPPKMNSFIESAGTGGWGGECTCPDGQTYQVGDHWAACANLACVNGVSGTCNRHVSPAWEGKGVVCAPLELLAPAAPPAASPWAWDPMGVGTHTCSTGPGPAEGECLGAVQGLLAPGQVQGRTNLVAGSWGHVPAGCSSQTDFTSGKQGDFAAHFNRNPNGQNDGGYTVVCAAPASPPPMEMPPMEMPPVEMPPMEGPPGMGPPMEGPPGPPPMECPPDQKDPAGRCPCPAGCVVDPLPPALANGIQACPSRCYVAACTDAYYYDAAPIIEKLMQMEKPRLEQLEDKGLAMTEEEFHEYKALVSEDTTNFF